MVFTWLCVVCTWCCDVGKWFLLGSVWLALGVVVWKNGFYMVCGGSALALVASKRGAQTAVATVLGLVRGVSVSTTARKTEMPFHYRT